MTFAPKSPAEMRKLVEAATDLLDGDYDPFAAFKDACSPAQIIHDANLIDALQSVLRTFVRCNDRPIESGGTGLMDFEGGHHVIDQSDELKSAIISARSLLTREGSTE